MVPGGIGSVLQGIRVLDLGRFIAGPFCAMLLADFGAEVIHVERNGGEEDRYLGFTSSSGDSFMFLNYARNKKAITLNFMTTREGKEILMKLVEKSDVFIHNFSPAAAKKIGVTYEEISSVNPRIIYTESSGFGNKGMDAERLGFDYIAQAISGGMALTGFPDHPPVKSEARYCDLLTGTFEALGVMLALHHRQLTGEGQKIEASLLKSGVIANIAAITEYEATGKKRMRNGNRALYTGPADLYKTKDQRWVFISLITKGLFTRWCRLIHREDLIDRPDLATEIGRYEKREELDKLLKDWVTQRTAEEVECELRRARLPYGFACDIEEVARNPQVRDEEAIIDLDCRESGKLKLCGTPLQLSKTPGEVKLPPPRVGEHNKEIYCGLLGYSEGEIDKLAAEGVI